MMKRKTIGLVALGLVGGCTFANGLDLGNSQFKPFTFFKANYMNYAKASALLHLSTKQAEFGAGFQYGNFFFKAGIRSSSDRLHVPKVYNNTTLVLTTQSAWTNLYGIEFGYKFGSSKIWAVINTDNSNNIFFQNGIRVAVGGAKTLQPGLAGWVVLDYLKPASKQNLYRWEVQGGLEKRIGDVYVKPTITLQNMNRKTNGDTLTDFTKKWRYYLSVEIGKKFYQYNTAWVVFGKVGVGDAVLKGEGLFFDETARFMRGEATVGVKLAKRFGNKAIYGSFYGGYSSIKNLELDLNNLKVNEINSNGYVVGLSFGLAF